MADVSPDSVRKVVTFPRELIARVEDFRFDNRIATEAEAIRRLIENGLNTAHVARYVETIKALAADAREALARPVRPRRGDRSPSSAESRGRDQNVLNVISEIEGFALAAERGEYSLRQMEDHLTALRELGNPVSNARYSDFARAAERLGLLS